MRRNTRDVAALLAVLALAAGCAGPNGFPTDPFGVTGTASTTTGTISGQVTASGAAFTGASVAIVNGPSTSTDAGGRYSFTGLTSGSYRVSILLPVGYTLAVGDSATVTATVARGQSTVVNWRLQPPTGGTGTGTTGTGTGTGTGG
ncbi:MAG: carboxypeptidase regulatory-like domain-containing protein [Gemmatimonadetes bacterium]|nr:carboxypeptidase regulatory-like domain-containing protein [Gemmatimonadota bacterium]